MKGNSYARTWYGLIATVGTVGLYTQMPGTLGTAVACVLLIASGGVSPWLLAVLILAGTIASDRYAKAAGKEDPGEVVVDEVAGYWISMLWLDMSYAIIAFFLFRVVDILKPFPVRNMEKLPGGVGIMADDICGGALVNILLRLLRWLFLAGGLSRIGAMLGLGW